MGTQFLVSEVLERIPSLRSAAKRRRRAAPRATAPRCRWGPLAGFQRTSEANGGSLYAHPPAALRKSSSGETQPYQVTITQRHI